MSEGKFVVFSGEDGSGKTTIRDRLKKEFPQIVITREPGATEFGARLRTILLDEPERDPVTELFLFFADRAHHVESVIRPALRDGKIVVSDRYWMDTFAYQWWARMNIRHANSLLNFENIFEHFNFPEPIRWCWFKVDPAIGLARKIGATDRNRIDQKSREFHEDVAAGFQHLYDRYKKSNRLLINANRSVDEVYAEVKASLAPILTL